MMYMRKLCMTLVTFLISCTFLLSNASIAGATDVWVDHWNDEDVDVYIVDDSLDYGYTSNGKWFSVSTKMVQNGQLNRVVKWKFDKHQDEVWRYFTKKMRDHWCAVIPQNAIFEYGMNQLGWSYSIRDRWYY